MKKWMNRFAVAGLALVGSGAFAEGEASGSVPTSVTTAITGLTADATAYADAITPYVKNVAVAFLAITAIAVVVGILRWGLKKATPSAR